MTARADFMDRLRVEVRRARPLLTASPVERPIRPRDHVDTIRRELAERWPATLERFRAEFERVGGVFHRVGAAAEVPDALAALAREVGAARAVTWDAVLGLDVARALSERRVEAHAMPRDVPDAPERAALRARIAGADLGVTGVDLAIAETGTLVLVSDAGRPRTTSLLPPCHVAIFDRTALVESLAQVGVFLEAWHAEPVSRERGAVVSFITGPSRTADIELTLTRGVHGPKEVHALFVEESGG